MSQTAPAQVRQRRPKKQSARTEGRHHDLRIRLSTIEYEKVQAAAGAGDMTISCWMRDLILVSLGTGGEYGRLAVEMQSLARQLSGIGNNLNQIAHTLNGGGSVDMSDIVETLHGVNSHNARLRKLLRKIRT
ncbi:MULTISPECIES: MobC family plasmid mobilization relaxosome protein [Acetobacter]|uniref:MobC family plasmid mobilization relaxosome protein n=1 Tax=Acetobacter TaxID=434 RepID=UPI0037707127